ncbi:MAG: bifunctional 2',3'-cyclic-nucleotide 2'-phosphodiesterase/3'-nucleotidase [Pseudotabrizicola sp.]|uniref:bifunctional 2',3'-cyclic-nucleotide 2'-phosphodiesterase/3'-nucleotidase n=1 Tax=Pseudotabrizicola sp. TaxID=2939647 RepID=UPI00272781AA|nr:bifunctional 2',3'-cyclic-nucleotide 2'-phosphodiesterase/3'-nucleotidase [Pseudotabrizicola sp.]MDO9640679.1 bifunctional 2',3'-cyclic-nucleotide 2'-phosphodiesterase/3'-nucleotidase [Pseudotabrizicola sp.]
MTADLTSAVFFADNQPSAGTAKVLLRLMATSDLHMHLSGHDYHADSPCVLKGLCLTASLITQARAEVAGSILLDNGDFLQGSPLGDYVARVGLRPHPMIHAMAHLGYDAVNLGNHEFSHGTATLAAALAEAPFPILSANTLPRMANPVSPLIRPWTMLERQLTDQNGQSHLLRIGVIGVLPMETEIWDRQAIAGQVRMRPMTETVARHIPDLQAAGADVIVVLAHCGALTAVTGSGPPEGALDIAALDGVDAVVMGHVHMVFPGPGLAPTPGLDASAGTLHGKPAVMPGFFGSHLGVIDLDLIRDGTIWRVASHRVAARPISGRGADGAPVGLVAPDETLTALIRPAHEATRTWARKPVGHTPRAIHSFFALATDCSSVQIINQAQIRYVTKRLAGGPLAHLPVLSATAPFRAGGVGGPENYTYIPPGDILLRHAADLYMHPNTIMALQITGAGLRTWLEYAARGYLQVVPGLADQPLIGADLPSFVYDTIFGLTYEIDLSAKPVDKGGQRIRSLCWQGAPLDPAQDFILATNSYRGSGNGGYTKCENTRVVLDEQIANRDILIAHISRTLSAGGSAQGSDCPGWRFRPLPGTSVIFDTSPLAGQHLSDQPHLALTPMCRTQDGFLRLRLTL